MNIKIGAKIKALRKCDDITQEQLAEVLGVSNQAISRWESESGYPDIEYITPLANFFNVTIDYLFDHDTTEKRRKIEEYCESFDEIARKGEPQEQIDLMRQALAEFPAEEKLLIRLAQALDLKSHGNRLYFEKYDDKYHKIDYEKHKSFEGWEEAAKIAEELLESSTDDKIRSKCRGTLARIYGRIGEKDKALAIAEKCDGIYCSKEYLLSNIMVSDGKDVILYRQQLLRILLGEIKWAIILLARDYIKDAHILKEAHSIMRNLYKFVFNDGDYEFYHNEMKNLYADYARSLILQNNIDEAFEELEKAYYHAEMFEEYLQKLRTADEVKYTSPFFDMTKDISKNISEIKSMSHLLGLIENKDNVYYRELNGDPRYTALIDKIKKAITEA